MPIAVAEKADRGRDLLFAVIALQMNFVSQAQFVEVMTLLPSQPDRGAEALFAEKGYLKAFQLAALKGLIDAQLQMHDGDIAKSIAAFEGNAAIEKSMILIGEKAPGKVPVSAQDTPTMTIVLGSCGGRSTRSRTEQDRYVLGRELGRGGLGRVVLALDRDLMGRAVAMKLMHDGTPADVLHAATTPSPGAPPARERFLEEAQITAQLQHPNIVAVYELGTRPGGEVYYTMPVVTGRSLKDEIRAAHGRLASGDVAREGWGVERLRLLGSFQALCHGLSYAHARGVIHRDVKPANVMVGEHGETVVVDWGLAKVKRLGTASDAAGVKEPGKTRSDRELEKYIRSLREQKGYETLEGTVTGTPAYMAPEQAAGRIQDIDERSDIYSLGAVLFEILTGRPPFGGGSAYEILFKVMGGNVPDPREVGARAPVPDDLASICLRAMRKEQGERFQSARALLDDIVVAVEGSKERERSHAEAERLVAAGRERSQDYAALRKEYRILSEVAKEAGKHFKGGEPVSAKEGWWKLQDEAKVAGRAVLGTFAEAERLFHQALEREHDHGSARAGLADLYYSQFLTAEGQDEGDFQYYGTLVKTYHDGKYARELAGDGTISITTEPEGADVYLYRCEERQRRLIPVPWRAALGCQPALREGEVATSAGWYLNPRPGDGDAFVGNAPVAAFAAPMGSYLAIIRKDGFPDVRRPIHVARNEDVLATVRLHRDDEIGEGFVRVPGGTFIAGGDPKAYSSWPRQVIEVDDFFIARFPVTCVEYLAFLNDVGARDRAAARQHAPRWQDQGGMHWLEEPEGVWAMPEGKDQQGMVWKPDEPIVEVNWHDANAYCAWRSEREGRPYRLPREAEWEKAARGVDARLFPWGNHFDASWCNMSSSRLDGPNRRGPIGEFVVDESPYGVRDLGGNACDWCSDLLREDQEWRVARGGVWLGGVIYCRSASRYGSVPTGPDVGVGFRLAASPRTP